uniref:Uncharacterized protein n=1 Tax=Oryza sativa subsp. japonica TaxID=39947 RepID=Q6YS12_ORYSJ|nr:hypothetical protein [Oryza sativa Japonica Group]
MEPIATVKKMPDETIPVNDLHPKASYGNMVFLCVSPSAPARGEAAEVRINAGGDGGADRRGNDGSTGQRWQIDAAVLKAAKLSDPSGAGASIRLGQGETML